MGCPAASSERLSIVLQEMLQVRRAFYSIMDSVLQWNTLEVLYEAPRVERLWTQLGPNRLSLHRIHPCDKPFYHPHPWPSCIFIVSGRYRMEIGYGDPLGSAPLPAALIDLGSGDSYEMLDSLGWHSVAPYGGPCLSLMLSGPPYPGTPKHQHPHKNSPLAPEVRRELLASFMVAMQGHAHV